MERAVTPIRTASGLAMVAGSVLPWFSRGAGTVTGLDGGDGWLTLVAGLALVASGLLGRLPPWLPVVAIGVATVIGVSEIYRGVGLSLSTKVGIWLLLAGCAGGLASVVLARRPT